MIRSAICYLFNRTPVWREIAESVPLGISLSCGIVVTLPVAGFIMTTWLPSPRFVMTQPAFLRILTTSS